MLHAACRSAAPRRCSAAQHAARSAAQHAARSARLQYNSASKVQQVLKVRMNNRIGEKI